jgi:adenosyl cobinamide kinase/adenosyl cobinamide phosphate guanylyltransferase
MGKLILVLGGARSGKSNFAMAQAKNYKSVLYIATYRRTNDGEMEERIRNHKKVRPKDWKIEEEPVGLSSTIKKRADDFDIVLIDCITLWVSNLILKKKSAEEISGITQELINAIKKANSEFIIVSNETGLGVVPDTKLGREFRDIAGRVNQAIARSSEEVYFVTAGIPMKIK